MTFNFLFFFSIGRMNVEFKIWFNNITCYFLLSYAGYCRNDIAHSNWPYTLLYDNDFCTPEFINAYCIVLYVVSPIIYDIISTIILFSLVWRFEPAYHYGYVVVDRFRYTDETVWYMISCFTTPSFMVFFIIKVIII